MGTDASVSISACPITILGAGKSEQVYVAVYACNHLSYMDNPVIFSQLPFQFRIVARHDLWKTALHRMASAPIRTGVR